MSQILKLMHKEVEDKDQIKHPVKIPFLEFQGTKTIEEYTTSLFSRPSPRLFVTHQYHDAVQIGPNGPKVIVVMRNPKDTLVSYYHFYRMNSTLNNFAGNWDEFFEMYKAKHLWGGDVLDFNIGWWNVRNNPNVLIMRFEDMKIEPNEAIATVAEFLGRKFTHKELLDIVEKSSFSSMKKDPKFNGAAVSRYNTKVSSFMRKGEVGDWRNYFSQEQNDFLDRQVAEKCESIGLHFKY